MKETTPAGDPMAKIAAAYTIRSWWYDLRGFFILLLAHNNTLGSQIRFFGPSFGAKDLEMACGNGTLLKFILNWRKRRGLPDVDITAIDYSESMLAGAKRRFAGWPGIRFLQADARDLPFPDATFDTVNIINAVHCIPEVDAALRSAYRVVKPGGTVSANVVLYARGFWPFNVIATRINAWGMRTGNLYTPYHAEDILAKFRAAGFTIASSEILGNTVNLRAVRPAA